MSHVHKCNKFDCIETFSCTLYIAEVQEKYGCSLALVDGLKACNPLFHQQFSEINNSIQDILHSTTVTLCWSMV